MFAMATSLTQLIKASVHFEYDFFKRYFENLEKTEKHYAPPIEFGINIDEIYKELNIVSKREFFGKSVQFILPIIAIIGLSMLGSYRTNSQGFVLLFGSVFFAVISEFIIQRSRILYVRENLLNNTGEEETLLHNDNIPHNNKHNVIVHKHFSPFAGFGNVVSGWSFVVDLSKADQGKEVSVLNITDLYDEVTEHISNLCIPSLLNDDFLFVHGQDVRKIDGFLSDLSSPPIANAGEHIFQRYRGIDSQTVRHYKLFQVSRWNGNLILSSLLRFTKVGNQLFVEFQSCLLPPVEEKFCVAESLTNEKKRNEVRSEILRSILMGPLNSAIVLLTIFGELLVGLAKIFSDSDAKIMKQIRSEGNFNFGAEKSLREEISTDEYDRYFQLTDKDMFHKILQAGVLDGTATALEKRGISTKEFKDQESHVLNQGVIISGGETKIENMAVGTGSKNWIGRVASFDSKSPST